MGLNVNGSVFNVTAPNHYLIDQIGYYNFYRNCFVDSVILVINVLTLFLLQIDENLRYALLLKVTNAIHSQTLSLLRPMSQGRFRNKVTENMVSHGEYRILRAMISIVKSELKISALCHR